MIAFRYDTNLLERFPSTRGGVILARNLTNDMSPPALAEAFRAEQQAAIGRIGNTPLSEIPSLVAWRRTFSAFGVQPTQYRSAAEALLRRLTKKGDIPHISLLVDLGNLVSIRYALPVAVLDWRGISGTLTVRFANGDEQFSDLGSSSTDHPEPGEVIFADEADQVSARRWCWRQSAPSSSRSDTTTALITVEGHHSTAEADVRAALDDLQDLLATYVPAIELQAALLSPAQPEFIPV